MNNYIWHDSCCKVKIGLVVHKMTYFVSKLSSNRLASSISPYLQQHAANPVHWQPWDDQALAEARQRDVPILLSIGYASCHWCHVMEHESFSDQQIAELMNEHFVCIKIDREERPDLDKTYQAAHYLLSRRTGGWPLNLFLDEELIPFFSGTYFPPSPKGGMIAWASVLGRVKQVWDKHRNQISEQRQKVWKALRDIDEPADKSPLSVQTLAQAVSAIEQAYDMQLGGLGKSPKFPQVPHLRFALQMCATGYTELEQGLRKTLDVMASGGLHDHVGGGFFRYCVDPLWDIPHFEKMLYDNAQLLELYARGASLWQSADYAYLATRTAQWLLAEIQLPEGGFASAIDADSDGQEGKFYIWSDENLQQVLDDSQLATLRKYANCADKPNFDGAYHLHQPPGSQWQTPSAQIQSVFASLLDARAKRLRPITDDKTLILSCALAAHALAQAGLYLDEPPWCACARQALEFVEQQMKPEGCYRTSWNRGRCSETGAFLDDVAHLLAARLSLLQYDCRSEDLRHAIELADLLISEYDDGAGGLLFTSQSASFEVRQIRSCDDGPIPSGNGVAARGLLTLGWLLGRTDYLEVAKQIIDGFSKLLHTTALYSPTLACALAAWLDPPPVVLLTGAKQKVREWHRQLLPHSHAGQIILPLYETQDLPSSLVKDLPPDGTLVWAHVCRGNTCSEPVKDIAELLLQIQVNSLKKQD